MASAARFRAKKKQQSQNLQRGIDELESRHAELERDVHDLRRENGFLKVSGPVDAALELTLQRTW